MTGTPYLNGYRETMAAGERRDSSPAELTATAHEIVTALRRDSKPGSAMARGIAAGIIAKLYGVDLSGGRA